MSVIPFTPIPGATKNIAATSTTASVDVGASGDQVLITNAGSNEVFITYSTASDVTATATTQMPILGNSAIVVTRKNTQRYFAAICSATETTTVYFTPGNGI